MKILVVGSGGREHALARTLLQSPQVVGEQRRTVEQVFCIPGNGGTASLAHCENVKIKVEDFEAIAKFAQSHNIALVVVGPEVPLAQGITDYLQQSNLTVFGPTQAGAQIEASKAWAKALMEAAGIPTAKAAVFTDADTAKTYVQTQGVPIVIKADGLAAGKGVTVATTLAEAESAIDLALSGVFGDAGKQLVIEECLTGQEVSILALTDGEVIRPLLSAQDHKRIGEGDTGPNTGGMGAYAPAPLVTPALAERIQKEVLEPALKELRDRNIHYQGILYAGLMITPTGDPKVIEFNCRFGDPETQAILPLLETPLIDLLLACTQGRLAQQPLEWKNAVSACVVMAAGGYPGQYDKHQEIAGIDKAEATGAIVYHAGTQYTGQQLLTDGGRVLNVVAIAHSYDQAFERAYHAIEQIQFANAYHRRDIGHRVRTPKSS